MRTGILPVVFLFNHELLLIGVNNIWHGILVITTSLAGILIFTSATQRWFFNKLKVYEIIIFLVISISLLSPEFVLNKFYPKYDFINLENHGSISFNKERDVFIKVTRESQYGERYKLFVIEKNSFEKNYSLEEYGISLIDKKNKIIVDNLKWNSLAKKSGIELDDYISELKVENLERPSKYFVYPIAIILFLIFGYLNYRRKE